jgi:hypothetical protein
MRVKPLLGDWEIPRIEAIRALEHRTFVEFPVPGRVGSLFQDLNTAPTRLAIAGSLYGDEVRDQFLEDLRGKFRAGEPVTFVADITTATDIQYVIIEELQFAESGTKPDQIDYLILISESPPPPPPPDPLGGIDTGLLDEAGNFLDSVTGALDVLDGLLDLPELSDPTEPLMSTLDGVTSALSELGGITSDLGELFGSS